MKNTSSEEFQLTSLLVHVHIGTVKAEEEEAYGTHLNLRAEEIDIRRELSSAIQRKDEKMVQTLRKRLEDSKGQLQKYQSPAGG